MNYADIKNVDVANGSGVRVSLFVSGCRNQCEGCFNRDAWDFDFGKEFTDETFEKLLSLLSPHYISGLSILGGEPLDPRNNETVASIVREVKNRYPNKTIWIYTGYRFDEIKHLDALNYIDVLVDGPFIESLRDISLKFRGSSNQRLINIPATRSSGKIITLWEG